MANIAWDMGVPAGNTLSAEDINAYNRWVRATYGGKDTGITGQMMLGMEITDYSLTYEEAMQDPYFAYWMNNGKPTYTDPQTNTNYDSEGNQTNPPTPTQPQTESKTGDTTTPEQTNVPAGYKALSNDVLLGPDGKYYDYQTWITTGEYIQLDDEYAKQLIDNWLKENPNGNKFFGGVPSKEQSADGTWWWVYKDAQGNIVNVEQVQDDEKEMSEYEKARLDLENRQFEWNKEQAMFEREQAEQLKYATPREWIQRWANQNAGGLPPAPDWLREHTGIMPGQTIQPGQTKLASGQSLAKLTPSELEGMYGYVDWAAGRGGKLASGEDWMYESQKLLPKSAPKRTISWNPDART